MRGRVVLVGSVWLAGCLAATGGQRVSTAGKGRTFTVAEMSRLGPQAGEYRVEAYLVGMELCEPCPEDAACERCRDENLALSDTPVLVQGYTAPGEGYLLLRPMKRRYTLGRKYRWKVVIPEHAPPGDSPPSVGYAVEAEPLP